MPISFHTADLGQPVVIFLRSPTTMCVVADWGLTPTARLRELFNADRGLSDDEHEWLDDEINTALILGRDEHLWTPVLLAIA